MAPVIVDKGPIHATTSIEDVPRDQWITLVRERRDFLKIKLAYDCRCLLEWLQEADKLEVWKATGFDSLDDMIRRGWELEPELVEWALIGLKSLKPTEAIPFEAAVEAGRRKKGNPTGNNQYKKQSGNNNNVIISTEVQGNTRSYLRDRLRRKHPEIFAKLETYPSVRAAALEAGIVKPMVQHQPTVEGFVRALKKHLTKSQINEVIVLLEQLTLSEHCSTD